MPNYINIANGHDSTTLAAIFNAARPVLRIDGLKEGTWRRCAAPGDS